MKEARQKESFRYKNMKYSLLIIGLFISVNSFSQSNDLPSCKTDGVICICLGDTNTSICNNYSTIAEKPKSDDNTENRRMFVVFIPLSLLCALILFFVLIQTLYSFSFFKFIRFRTLKSILFLFTIGILFFIIYNGMFNDKMKKKIQDLDDIKIKNVSILIPKSTSQPIPQITTHNELLINSLSSFSASQVESIIRDESDITQSRMIYFMIMVAIITFIIYPFKKNQDGSKIDYDKSKSKNGRTAVYMGICVMIMLMYFAEVHIQDQLIKPNKRREFVNNAIDIIINQDVREGQIYYIFWPDIIKDKIFKDFDRWGNRIPRKLRKIFTPNLVQDIYYIIPLILLIFLIFFEYLKKEEGHDYFFKRKNKPSLLRTLLVSRKALIRLLFRISSR